MNKPISLRINEMLKGGKPEEAYRLALAAHKDFPKVLIYKQLLAKCEASRPKDICPNETSETIGECDSSQREVDLETLEYHLRNKLEKVRAKEIGAIQAWSEISFLAPSKWPRDPRLTRILTPKSSTLDRLGELNKQSDKRILIVSGDLKGGAGIAALRIFQCLNNIGQNTDIIYRDKDAILMRRADGELIRIETEDCTQTIYGKFDSQLIEELRGHIANEVHLTLAGKGRGSNTFLFHSEESLDISKIARSYNAINIHWSDFLLTSVSLERLADHDIPITITMHDMYWLNGTCHYSAGCTQFTSSCTSCPLVTRPSDPIALFNTYHAKTLRSLKDLSIISPSEWLCELSALSKSLSGKDIFFILNPQPKPTKEETSRQYQKDSESITIIYGALGLTEKRKGYDLFVAVCREIANHNGNVQFKVFGSLTGEQEQELRLLSTEVLGFLNQKDLSHHLARSDAMLLISHEDNYPNLCVEAAALGLPVIASDNSGLRSFIQTSGGGILVSNSAAEIAETVTRLTKSELSILGANIYNWHDKHYSTTNLEEAYQSVILRSNNHKKYIYHARSAMDNAASSQKQANQVSNKLCRYVTRISDFAVELLVPPSPGINKKYSLSYTLEDDSMGALDLYIDGYSYDAKTRINSDGRTYIIDELPSGKPLKLINHDSATGYYYRKLGIVSLNVYPYSLTCKQISPLRIAGKESNQIAPERMLILCDDSVIFEDLNGEKVYWLLANRSYSMHFIGVTSDAARHEKDQINLETNILVIFRTIDLRHNAARNMRLVLNGSEGAIQVMPTIDEYGFCFSLKKSLVLAMQSAFLNTGPGEVLDDGREVVALVSRHEVVEPCVP